jgi:anti-anti-sigma regulatory factor
MTENFNSDYKENKDLLEITFSGQLTINNIKKINESVKSHLRSPGAVSIHVKDVDNIDLTFIQLLQAIKNSGKKKGFSVQTGMELPNDLKALLINAGFGKMINNNN